MGPARAHGHTGRKTYALMSSRAENLCHDVRQSNTKVLHDMRARSAPLYVQFFSQARQPRPRQIKTQTHLPKNPQEPGCQDLPLHDDTPSFCTHNSTHTKNTTYACSTSCRGKAHGCRGICRVKACKPLFVVRQPRIDIVGGTATATQVRSSQQVQRLLPGPHLCSKA